MCSDLPRWLVQIEEDLDFELLVRLRDGRSFVGFLVSFDHYGNLLLSSCRQRISAFEESSGKVIWADVPFGALLVRGENVSLAGRLKAEMPACMEERPVPSVMRLALESDGFKNFTWKEDDEPLEWA